MGSKVDPVSCLQVPYSGHITSGSWRAGMLGGYKSPITYQTGYTHRCENHHMLSPVIILY